LGLLKSGPKQMGQRSEGKGYKRQGRGGFRGGRENPWNTPYPKVDLTKSGRKLYRENRPRPARDPGRLAGARNPNIPAEFYALPEECVTTIMFVGDAPGKDDDLANRVFHGRAGHLLRFCIENSDQSAYNIYLTNVVNTMPPIVEHNPEIPTEESIESNREALQHEIELVRPRVIIALGQIAVSALIDEEEGDRLVNKRGNFYPCKFDPAIRVMATWSPSMIVRNPHRGSQLFLDITKASANTAFDISKMREQPEVKWAKTLPELREAVAEASKAKVMAFDFETTGLSRCPGDNAIVSLHWSTNSTDCWGVLVDHPDAGWTKKQKPKVRRLLKDLLRNKVPKIAHNAKFDLAIARGCLGIRVAQFQFDTMIMQYLLDENINDKTRSGGPPMFRSSLDAMVQYWLDFVDPDWEAAKEHRSSLIRVPGKDVIWYGSKDACYTLRLYKLLRKLIAAKDSGLLKTPMEIMAKLSYSVSELESAGLPFDMDLATKLLGTRWENSLSNLINRQRADLFTDSKVAKFNEQLNDEQVKPTLFKVLDDENEQLFDPMKTQKHLVPFYYEFLRLQPPPGAEEGKFPTGKDFEEHYGEIEVVRQIKEYKQAHKMRGFIESFVDAAAMNTDERIRASFRINSTVTGRLSCTDPNLQQIPRAENEIKTWIKRIVAVPPGWVLIAADYSTAEVRIGAITSKDDKMAAVFRAISKLKAKFRKKPTAKLYERIFVDGEGDAHKQNYSRVFGIPVGEVTKDQRTEAKGITFGCMFSGTPEHQMAGKLGIPVEEAKIKVDAFLGPFINLTKFLKQNNAAADNVGFVYSLFGRRRTTYGAWSIKSEHTHARNQCQNSGIQSTASDVQMLAVYKFWQYVYTHEKVWRAVNVVHDSIYFVVPRTELRDAVEVIEDVMLDPGLDRYGIDKEFTPLEVDMEIGLNAADTITWDFTTQHMDLIEKWLDAGADRECKPKSPFAKKKKEG